VPPVQKLLRLRRVNFSQTVNVGGIAATTWVDGHMGWELNLRPDSGVLMLTNGDETFAVSPTCWVSCEVGEPEVVGPTLTAAEATAVLVEHSQAMREADAKGKRAKRIDVAEIRARQAEAQAARSRDT
jgi:hypothetical protein